MSESELKESKRLYRPDKCWLSLCTALTYGLERWVPDLRIRTSFLCGHWVEPEAAEEFSEHVNAFLHVVV